MFGIGGGEFIFIILIILMFFGSDKIPELARTLGKGIAQLKNATNDIKSEITKGVENSGLDANSLTGGITDEIAKAKEGFTKMIHDSGEKSGLKSELDQIRDNFAKLNEEAIAEANGIQNTIGEPATTPEAIKITESTPAPETSENDEEGPIKRQR